METIHNSKKIKQSFKHDSIIPSDSTKSSFNDSITSSDDETTSYEETLVKIQTSHLLNVAVTVFRLVIKRYDRLIHYIGDLDYLLISSVNGGLNKYQLNHHKITHILVAGPRQLPKKFLSPYDRQIVYNIKRFPDSDSYNAKDHLIEAADYIDQIYSSQSYKCKILVCCYAGHSRSASICCTYLMKYLNKDYNEAINIVRKNRPDANPNIGFKKQLLEISENIHGKKFN